MSPFNRSAVLVLTLLTALPALAATRPRPVRPAGTPLGSPVVLSGTVTDVDSGFSVVQAQVTAGVAAAMTRSDGRFELQVPSGAPLIVTAKRSGYEDVSVTVTPGAATAVQLKMKSKEVITLRTVSGGSYTLDGENAQFAYLIPLSGYARSDKGNFCKSDGTPFQPEKSELRRIAGPAVAVTGSACCPTAPVLQTQVELKTGEKLVVNLMDSCVGYEAVFLGRDHSTADWRYVRFADIAEILFP